MRTTNCGRSEWGRIFKIAGWCIIGCWALVLVALLRWHFVAEQMGQRPNDNGILAYTLFGGAVALLLALPYLLIGFLIDVLTDIRWFLQEIFKRTDEP